MLVTLWLVFNNKNSQVTGSLFLFTKTQKAREQLFVTQHGVSGKLTLRKVMGGRH